MKPLLLIGAAIVATVVYVDAAHASCKGPGRQVLVKEKTPVRKGPGLNYPVKNFLEKGRCLTLTEISVDRAWALVEGGDLFGWVPTGRLDAAGQKVVAAMSPGAAPVGSGQARGHVFAKDATPMKESPSGSSNERKMLPEGAKLLALSMTPDEQWVEVRDDRNDTGWVPASALKDPDKALSLVPRADGGVSGIATDVTNPPAPPGIAPRNDPQVVAADPEPPARTPAMGSGDLVIDARLLLGAQLPAQGFDSNAPQGYRRYDISSFSGAARVEARAAPLGPMEARLSYAFALLSGLSPANNQFATIGGRHHEARLIFGLPVAFDGGVISPEAGYFFAFNDMDTAIPGATVAQFLSTVTHAGTAGLSAAFDLSSSMYLEAEAAMLLGTTSEDPFDAGSPGLTVGAVAGAGLGFALDESIDLLVRYDLRFRRTSFSGASLTDPAMTEASLTYLDNAFMAGLGFAL